MDLLGGAGSAAVPGAVRRAVPTAGGWGRGTRRSAGGAVAVDPITTTSPSIVPRPLMATQG